MSTVNRRVHSVAAAADAVAPVSPQGVTPPAPREKVVAKSMKEAGVLPEIDLSSDESLESLEVPIQPKPRARTW